MINKPIIPEREKCSCKKPVKNHHWLCDECWGKKCKIEYRIKQLEKLPKDLKDVGIKKQKIKLKKLLTEVNDDKHI